MVSKLFTTFVAKIKSPQKILIMTTYRFAITGLRHHDFANRLDELYDKAKMSQGQVNDIKNNAQFLGFKNDRGVIPLCYDFPCKFIKIK